MPNPLFQQLQGSQQMTPKNPMLQRLSEFKKMVNGNPQQMVQQMLNSGKISQAQINQYAKQADEIYRQFKGMF